jgi:uncharacterized membrane protein
VSRTTEPNREPAQTYNQHTVSNPLLTEIAQLRELLANASRRLDELERNALHESSFAASREGAVVGSEHPSVEAAPSVEAPRIEVPPAPGPEREWDPQTPSGTGSSDRDLEARIGGNLLNKIGFTAILVGVAYFLKHAFESGWVGPVGRVVFGLVAGATLIAASELWLRRGHRRFAHSGAMLGVGILYLSVWAATEVYRFLPNSLGFGALALLTAGAVGLALVRDVELIAGLALFGAFLTPVLLASGDDRQLQLFGYILLLDAAAAVLVVRKGWMGVLLVAFLGSTLLYLGWKGSHFDALQLGSSTGFVVIVGMLFAIAPLLGAGRKIASRTLIAFTNALFLLGQLFDLHEGETARVLVLLAIAITYFAIFVVTRGRDDQPARLHLGIAILALTIAVPIALDAEYLTLAWLLEGAILLLFAARHERTALILGALIFAIGIVHLVFVARFDSATPILNMRLVNYGVAIAALIGIALRAHDPAWKRLAVVASNVMIFFYLNGEIEATLGGSPGRDLLRDFTFSAAWMLHAVILMMLGFRRASALLRWLALALFSITILKVFFYDLSNLERLYRIFSFIILGGILMAISYAYQRRWLDPLLEKEP